MGSLIYLLSTRADFRFALHKLAKFSAKPGKVHFGGLIHLLRYIRYNSTLGLKYYEDMNDAVQYTMYPSTDRGSSLAVNYRTMDVRVTLDRPSTP